MNKKLITVFLSGISVALGTFTLNMPSSNARPSSHSFSCANVNGNPATVAQRGNQQIVMIRWSKNDGYFGDGWTPERRCKEVSAKFQQFSKDGSLRYITYTTKKGYPIVCVAKTQGGNCTGQLFTLRKTDNPREKVTKLLDRNNISSNPLNESQPAYIININDKVYLDLSIYLGEEKITPEKKQPSQNIPSSGSSLPNLNNTNTNNQNNSVNDNTGKNPWFFE